MRELDQAPFGIIGLETSLSVVITKLVRPGILDWQAVAEKMSLNPAKILGIPKGTLAIGADADITIVDPDAQWTVFADDFHSKSKNSPYIGWKLFGRASAVFVGGVRRV
jgi:dihydroorotase